ncbi:MAG: class I SAM-dependent methyltransferase [Candidatus Omnitrophota bacterium]
MEPEVYQQFYELEKDHWWFRGMRYLCKKVIETYCKDEECEHILDIGCGTGELTKSLEIFGNVFGADSSADALAFCKKRGLYRLVRTSAECTGFKDNFFSLIVAFGLIEHLNDDKLFLAEMRRILKDHGHLIILTSAFQFLWSSHDEIVHHKRRYTRGGLKKMMEGEGFRVNKISYINSFLFPAIAAVRFFQRRFDSLNRSRENFLGITNVPPLINSFFYKILQAEAKILNYTDLPFGVGIISVGEKKSVIT